MSFVYNNNNNNNNNTLVDSATDVYRKVRLLAVTVPQSGDWLYARSMSTCCLRLDNEAIKVAVGLRVGLPLCLSMRRCG